MGGVISLGSLACCCTSAACSLCCAACPSCKNSTSARIMYAIMLLLTTIVSCILLAPGLQEKLKSVPFCKEPDPTPNDDSGGFDLTFGLKDKDPFEGYQFNCSEAVGYLAVYRLCLIVTLFFTLMAILTIGVKSSKVRF